MTLQSLLKTFSSNCCQGPRHIIIKKKKGTFLFVLFIAACLSIFRLSHIQMPCNASFGATLEENMRVVKAYPVDGARPYLEKLGFSKPCKTPNRQVPVIATASSANHFYESLLLMENVRDKLFPQYPELEIHYYDIGLWESQKKRIKTFPKTVFHRFPFEDFPDHVRDLSGYAWKPIIIQMVLQENGFVLWVDASIRFDKDNIDRIFDVAREKGVCVRAGSFPVSFHTDADTFRFLGEDPCLFEGVTEIEANFISVYNTELIRDYVMKPMVSCALQPGCMMTENSASLHNCAAADRLGFCHRFDQSVTTIILTRLFSKDFASITVPGDQGVQIYRSFTIPFLPESINRLMLRLTYRYMYDVDT